MKDYFEFKGVKYGIGTIIKVPTTRDLRWIPKEELTKEAKFVGQSTFVFISARGSITLYESSGHFSGKYENYIEIINPVYYQEPNPPKPQNIFLRTRSGSWDTHNEVCVGFIWYVAIMLFAIIFKDRIAIWILVTIVYFLWKANK